MYIKEGYLKEIYMKKEKKNVEEIKANETTTDIVKKKKVNL